MHRTLRPELLDSLSPDDPAARRNRRDLRLTNVILGNHRWLVARASRLFQAGEAALEIGAGTGELGRRLQQRGLDVDGLDLWPRPEGWPAARAWHAADLRVFAGYERYTAILGNLIFHQFTDTELAALGARIRVSARIILACEPARRRVSQGLYRLVGPLLGANHVSLHDAHVSIAAGFRGEELPRLLGLDAAVWNVTCSATLLGACRMTAVRRG